MAGQLIAFPGVTIEPRKATIRTKRERYFDGLSDQANAGDVGANAELNVMIIRDWLARCGALPTLHNYCNVALGDIRKLRRQLEGLGK